MNAIQFESVSKVFKTHRSRPRSFQELVTSLGRRRPAQEEIWVLRDESFSVSPGETAGLIDSSNEQASRMIHQARLNDLKEKALNSYIEGLKKDIKIKVNKQLIP